MTDNISGAFLELQPAMPIFTPEGKARKLPRQRKPLPWIGKSDPKY